MKLTPENQIKLIAIQKKNELYCKILDSLEFAKDNLTLSDISISGELSIQGNEIDININSDSDQVLNALITDLEIQIRILQKETNKLLCPKTS